MLEHDLVLLREEAHQRAWGRCECTDPACGHHVGRCGAGLRGAWDIRRTDPDRPMNVTNVIAVCKECRGK